MTHARKILAIALVLPLCSACTVWQYADNIKLVGLKPEKSPAKRLGRLNDEVCESKIEELFSGRGERFTFEAAMEQAVAGHKVAYFRSVTSDLRQPPGEGCIVFMGDAYL